MRQDVLGIGIIEAQAHLAGFEHPPVIAIRRLGSFVVRDADDVGMLVTLIDDRVNGLHESSMVAAAGKHMPKPHQRRIDITTYRRAGSIGKACLMCQARGIEV